MNASRLIWLAPTAARPEYEDLVLDFLGIPPYGGDYLSEIKRKFAVVTDNTLPPELSSIFGTHILHPQLQLVEEMLRKHGAVLLVGSPGTGKSGIAYTIATSAKQSGGNVILLDARRAANLETTQDLRRYFDLQGSLDVAVEKLAAVQGCLLIVDQLDSIAGTSGAEELISLARTLGAVRRCTRSGDYA